MTKCLSTAPKNGRMSLKETKLEEGSHANPQFHMIYKTVIPVYVPKYNAESSPVLCLSVGPSTY